MGIGKEGTVSPTLTQLTKDYQTNMKALREATLAAGKFAWQVRRLVSVSVAVTRKRNSRVGGVLTFPCSWPADAVDGWRGRLDRWDRLAPPCRCGRLRRPDAYAVRGGQPLPDACDGLRDVRPVEHTFARFAAGALKAHLRTLGCDAVHTAQLSTAACAEVLPHLGSL